jgi:peptidoglycan/LPS O-acetylase OafA/YrhL
MRRFDIVVPAHLVDTLHIPPIAVTTGETDVAWVEIPTSTRRFRRRPVQRLPLDPRSARRVKRYLRLTPWSLLISLLMIPAFGAVVAGWSRGTAATVAYLTVSACVLALSQPRIGGQLPPQTPRRDRHGDLRIPDVPIGVAEQWLNLNPGVTITDQPAPRPRSQRFYAACSVSLVLTAVALSVVLANDGREDFILFQAAVPALFLAGLVAAFKLLPPGYIQFERNNP